MGTRHLFISSCAAAALLVLVGCGSSDNTGPELGTGPAAAVPITIGDTVAGQINPSDSALYYRFRTVEAIEIAIFADPSAAPAVVTLVDSVSQQEITGVYAEPGLELLDRRSPIAQLVADRTYFVRVVAATQSFRLFVYRVNRAPEHHRTALELEEVVDDETLETSADIDEFTLPGVAGQEMIGFLEALDPSLKEISQLATHVPPRPGGGERVVRAGVGDPEAAATGRFILPESGTVHLTLSVESTTWKPGVTQPGRLRFSVRAIDRKPEQGGGAVAIGDTVEGGRIDFVGDVDEYTIQASAGAELNVFLQALNDTATSELTLRVLPPTEFPEPLVQSKGTDEILTTQATGRFIVPSTGALTLQVAGLSDVSGLHRGTYRFFVYPVRRTPEVAGVSLTLGQPIETETIELPGDLDEFVLTAPQTTLANFVLSGHAGIRLSVLQSTSDEEVTGITLFPESAGVPADVAAGVGTFLLQSGTYRLRVEGLSSTGEGYRGGYRVETHSLSALPETVPPVLAVGTTLTSESLTPVGDEDVFQFSGKRGDLLDLTLRAAEGAASPGFSAAVFLGPGTTDPLPVVTAGPGNSEPRHSGRFELPADGTFQLLVSSINGGRRPSEAGPYRLSLLRYDPRTEHASADIAPGDVVTTEGIEELGDVDDFLLSAVPGSEIQVLFQKGRGDGSLIEVAVSDPTTGVTLRSGRDAGAQQAIGRIKVPPSGKLRLRVEEPRFPGCSDVACAFRVLDSYRLSPFLLHRSPEIAASAIVLGTLVEGEAIEVPGDVDEFSFSGGAGQTVQGYLQSVRGFPGGPMMLEILTPAGQVIGNVQVANPDGGIRLHGTGTVVLPVTGTYRVRVSGVSDTDGTGEYRVLLE